ncbi:BNR repeat-containing protein [Cellulophaga sp. BC115SP]|uniref:BNR repeat-containing protein n=1 Tax=Cellulophaga sp. BC115SP TaxID=2683263 RepID=UPI001411BEBF|nr:BNR repeat-containing protein [Cellulophaga sp. BC115SP]NBB31364.1 neuraminidase [Cellulophaga sp. BC115SP]
MSLLKKIFFCLLLSSFLIGGSLKAQTVKVIPVGKAWANNSVNAVIFRKNSLVSYKNYQFIAYYNETGNVVLGKRKLGSKNWELKTTDLKGNVTDAHNCISIMVDGKGYLHIAWDHHNHPLHYAKSKSPLSLELDAPTSMTGETEKSVSYPEFYRMPNGNLLFFYRNGASGKGNLVVKSYDISTSKWSMLHENLIDGEGKRSAYWQAFVDAKSNIHISWVWRESADVASNHDMAYACSKDGGKTWQKTSGEKYQLPINASNAEYACKIPQNSELINQTSMVADQAGNPYIATYFRPEGSNVPQYHLIHFDGKWHTQSLGFRTQAFSLSGMGTKKIPIARPQLVAWSAKGKLSAMVVFRDEERGSKASVAVNSDLNHTKWQVKDLTNTYVGSWEPSFDTELWKSKQQLHLFVQPVEQADGEGKTNTPPQLVQVFEVKL